VAVAVASAGFAPHLQSFAPHSRQITMPIPHHSIFYGPDALPDAQPTVSKHCYNSTFLIILMTISQQQDIALYTAEHLENQKMPMTLWLASEQQLRSTGPMVPKEEN